MTFTDEKIKALAQHLELDEDVDLEEEITEEYDNTFSYGNGEYLVLTDEEADEEEDAQLDNYLEECIYPDLPENVRYYFDDDAWKRDARMDGRGHIISHYDGCEYEETVNGTTYYIYRI